MSKHMIISTKDIIYGFTVCISRILCKFAADLSQISHLRLTLNHPQ